MSENDTPEQVVQRVLALADEWAYKGEFGWGPWQEGYGPDPEGQILDDAARQLRAAVAGPQRDHGEEGQ